MDKPLTKFFSNAERASTVLIVGSVVVMVVGLIIAIAALFFMR